MVLCRIIWIRAAGRGQGISAAQGTGSFIGRDGLWALTERLFYWLMGASLRWCAINADNPSCVRPDHLYAGDVESNLIDIMLNRIRKDNAA